ncbi:MAG: DNA polymerase III subunit gamma/tau [Nostocales cyanobacterium]|nr:MAG: DNA polymerase III subunit gamma/tau [Nostocales cyanobacterium]TAF05570.1 MAG: DNA polymerase III subunit gamma/tau [Nostocales cyanobacterium]
MPYEPLHHKYRPKSFAELVGQEAIATTLTNAINSAKIAPAYLFTGPRGTGKTSSARILAKSLNCLKNDKPTPEPCGVCETCQSITKGYSLDVIEIDAASNTGVDNIRELIEKAQFAPVQCRYKVYVIDECHMLSTAAFNALLKTLEEPPKHVVFVLATTDPQRVLPTIISRCQRFDFRRIQLTAMVNHLSKIAANESITISKNAITLVAQLSQGGLRDAESLLDQLALLPGEVSPDQVWDLVGSVSEKDLFILLEAIAQDNSEIVLDATRKILDRGREPLIILQNLASFYRDLLIAKTAPTRQDLVACTQETWTELVNFAHKLETPTILHGQQHLRTAEVQLKNTTQPRLWLEVTLLGLLPSANIKTQVITQVANIPQTVSAAAVSPPPPQPTYTQPANYNPPPPPQPTPQPANYNPPPPQPQPTPTAQTTPTPTAHQPEVANPAQNNLSQIWYQVLANLQPPSRREMLRQMSELLDFDGNLARIAIKQAWYEKGKSDLPIITTAFQQTFQRDIQVTLEKAASTRPTTGRNNTQPQDSTRVQSPPTTTTYYQPSPAPTSLPSEPAVTNTPPLNNPTPISQPPAQPTPISSTPISQPPVSSWDHEEVTKAAKSLANFFSGEIVRMTDDSFDLSDLGVSPDMEIYDIDD